MADKLVLEGNLSFTLDEDNGYQFFINDEHISSEIRAWIYLNAEFEDFKTTEKYRIVVEEIKPNNVNGN